MNLFYEKYIFMTIGDCIIIVLQMRRQNCNEIIVKIRDSINSIVTREINMSKRYSHADISNPHLRNCLYTIMRIIEKEKK